MIRHLSTTLVAGLFWSLLTALPTQTLAQTCPTGQPCDIGEWGDILDNWPLSPQHLILLKNEKVFCLQGLNSIYLWDASNSLSTAIQGPIDSGGISIELFCSGHSQLADGRIVFVGGGDRYIFSHNHTVIFDPDAVSTPCMIDADCTLFTGKCDVSAGVCDPWTVMMDMPTGKRWYPTCTTLSDGRVLVLGGDPNNHTPS